MTKRKLTDEERAIVSAIVEGSDIVKAHLLENFDAFKDANPLAKTFLPTPVSKAYLSKRLFELMDKALDQERWSQDSILEICSTAFMLSLAVHKPQKKEETDE